mmetsp:Transcript_47132/g.147503  ORF Transcript_47132/g.147503 Transcript_47132/m.147503 type:complete len:243 (+) Transcript_47132:680-1408(+)
MDVLHHRRPVYGSRGLSPWASAHYPLVFLPDLREDGVWLVRRCSRHSVCIHNSLCNLHQHGGWSNPDQYGSEHAVQRESEHGSQGDPDRAHDRPWRHLSTRGAPEGSEGPLYYLLLCDAQPSLHGPARRRHQVPPQPLLPVYRPPHPHLHRAGFPHRRLCPARDLRRQEVRPADLDGLVDYLLLELVGILVAICGNVHCEDLQGEDYQGGYQCFFDRTCPVHDGLVRSVRGSRAENGEARHP